ncbi:MAG: glycosyltransferase family 2 protein [Anaerolineaceae bacterium]
MTKLPLVSIITPSHNQAQYLEATIQSVLDQDYPNLEYIIVDGGSTDGSQEIIKKYQNQLVWWISERDRGQADGINKGLARARGEFVAWLNSDDLYQPGAILEAVKALQQNPDVNLVFGNVAAIDAEGQITNLMRYGDWRLEDLMHFEIIGQAGVFMRRAALEVSGTLDLSYQFLLDHHLWLRIGAGGCLRHIDRTWAAARFHAAAKNVARAQGFGVEALRIAHWMEEYPPLRKQYLAQKNKVWAGAYRMNGRYLLDDGLPWKAFAAYMKSLFFYPPIALKETHRILYALVSSMVNIEFLKKRFLEQRRKKVLKNQAGRDVDRHDHE